MSRRPLSDEEAALWKRVIATVDPLVVDPPERRAHPATKAPAKPETAPLKKAAPPKSTPPKRPAIPLAPSQPVSKASGGLDGHWDRRFARGAISPDVTIDLHGHSLERAYARLDTSLELAIASGHRVVLLITGKPRPRGGAGEGGRGAIRAAVSNWLSASRHAGRIAAVRGAHPRHGGQGALYIVLRRPAG